MKHRALVLAVLMAAGVTFSAVAHAGTQFLAYEGKDAIQDGRGGEKKVVGGIEFWLDGSPPHRFQILGTIQDERHKTGLIGAIAMSSLEADVAKAARAAGGDAVILMGEQDNVQGYAGSTFGNAQQYGNRAYGNAYSHSRPIESHASKYLVVKYLPDPPPPVAP